MKHYKVLFKVYHSKNHVETKALTVEAGTKALAAIRAMQELCKDEKYKEKYKTLESVEEVAA